MHVFVLTTFGQLKLKLLQCNHQRTIFFTVFTAEAFFPSLGNFIAGWYFYGLFKLFLFILCLFCMFDSSLYDRNNSEKDKGTILFFCSFLFVLLYILDFFGYFFVLYMFNHYIIWKLKFIDWLFIYFLN